jgi:hypothetical protein
VKAAEQPDGIDWSLTTWEGARREQLRRWAELSLEEILRAQEEMAEISERLAGMPKTEPQEPLRRRIAPGEASARGRRR